MAERPDNAEPSTTVVDNEHTSEDDEPLTVRLKLRKPVSKKKVRWISGTVDNENDNKKKSKCCCIYHKPREFDESSSESDGECENCFGHVEMKKKKSDSDSPPPGPSEEDKPNKDSENNGDLNPEEATPQES